jgi:hypothetical protein
MQQELVEDFTTAAWGDEKSSAGAFEWNAPTLYTEVAQFAQAIELFANNRNGKSDKSGEAFCAI